MRTVSKNAVIFPLAMLLIAAVLLSFVFLSPDSAAAQTTDYEIVYPEEGYFPIERAELVAANAGRLAVYDAAAHAVLVLSEDDAAARMDAPLSEQVTGLWLTSSALLLRTTAQDAVKYYFAELSASSVLLTPTTLDTPEAIEYIVADSDFFYAKSNDAVALYALSSGALTMSKLIDDQYVKGRYIFAADEGVLYFYAVNYSEREYICFDTTSETAEAIIPDVGFLPTAVAYCGSAAAGGILADGLGATLKMVSSANGSTVLFDTGIAYDENTMFAADGNTVYVVNGSGVDVYGLDFSAKNATLIRTLSMKGVQEGLFASPTDVAFSPAGTVVADPGNSRLAVYSDGVIRYVSLSSEAQDGTLPVHSLAVSKNGIVFAASDNMVYALAAGGSALSLERYCGVPSGERITDIAHTGTSLVILTDKAMYVCHPYTGSPTRAADASDGVAVAAAQNDVVYLMSETGVSTFSVSGTALTELVPFRTCDLVGAGDIAVDFAGNVYVAFTEEGKIISYKNAYEGLQEQASFELTHPLYSAHPVSVTLNGSEAYFASSDCFVGKADVGAIDEESYHPLPHPDTDAAEGYSFAAVTQDSFLFDEPDRFDTMSALAKGAVVLCYDGISAWEGHTYVYSDGKAGYVENSVLQSRTPDEVNSRYTLAAGSVLLAHPLSDRSVTVTDSTVLTVTDNAAGLDGGAWLRVSYEGDIYFAPASALSPYVEPVPEVKRVFGRASADRPGGLINVYTLPDTASAVVTQAADGTRMEIVGESGDFWLVAFDGKTGYALKAEVEMEGLTTVQIVSIVLCCAVAVTGLVVFVVVWQARKKEKEKE